MEVKRGARDNRYACMHESAYNSGVRAYTLAARITFSDFDLASIHRADIDLRSHDHSDLFFLFSDS